MSITKIALIGNPNVGKSTLFNQLTGLKQRVGNYPGTTVEKRLAKIKHKGEDIILYDFPGTYSLYPKSADEEVVFHNLIHSESKDCPDKVIVVGSPLQLKRSFLLLQEIQDLGIPTLFILNRVDEVSEKDYYFTTDKIEEVIGEKVICTNARTGGGTEELKDRMLRDFPSQASKFEIPAIYKTAVEEVQSTFHLDNEYWAWHYLAQPNIVHLTKKESAQLNAIKEKHHVVSSRMQISETMHRYEKIDPICEASLRSLENKKTSLNDKLDAIFTHPVLGYAIFFGLLFLAFQAIFSWAEVPMDFIDNTFAELQTWCQANLGDGPLASLISDGVIPGIGGIVIFVPQITILIFFMLILEETGYMSRVVFLMDKWMRPFGLNGKSVVPLMSGAACAVPGIMAARNIENTKERLITILVTPFITCSARLPVYAILIALVIPKETFWGFNLQGIVLMLLYLLGVFAALLFAFLFKLFLKTPYKSYLIMELPSYRLPHWRNIGLGLWEKVSAFVFGAGKIILAVSVVLWVLANWGITDNFKNAEEIIAKEATVNNWDETEEEYHLESYKLSNSLLGNIGKTIEPVFRPLGYDWKISIGVLTSFAAREVFVGTMASIYSLGGDDENSNQILAKMRNETHPNGEKVFSLATGISLMLFYALAMQCLTTLAIVKKETGTWKWPVIQLLFMTGSAYVVSLLAYQLLS